MTFVDNACVQWTLLQQRQLHPGLAVTIATHINDTHTENRIIYLFNNAVSSTDHTSLITRSRVHKFSIILGARKASKKNLYWISIVVSKVPLLHKEWALQNLIEYFTNANAFRSSSNWSYNAIAEFKTLKQLLSPSSHAKSPSVTDEFPRFYEIRKFINSFLHLKNTSQSNTGFNFEWFWQWYTVIVVAKILDSVHCFRLKETPQRTSFCQARKSMSFLSRSVFHKDADRSSLRNVVGFLVSDDGQCPQSQSRLQAYGV
jgi:hypothetical protein